VLRRTLNTTHASAIGAGDLAFENLDLPILEPEYLDTAPGGTALQAEPPILGGAARSPQAVSGAQRDEAERSSSGPQANEAHQAGGLAGNPDRPSRPMQSALQEPSPEQTPTQPPDDAGLRRLSAAVVHEVGNPLVGIRTYASMLPTRFDDPEFRSQFSERVEADTRRIEAVLETLARVGGLTPPAHEPIDVSSLLARLLERERPQIRERRLVVLEELDRAQPFAIGDAEQLRFAFGLLLEQALAWMPARGDLYLATRHRAEPAPQLRILLRFRAPNGDGLGFAENALSLTAVEAVVHAHGGSLAIDSAVNETSIVIDLPASEDATAR
jgi:signal transduction histidine kinase